MADLSTHRVTAMFFLVKSLQNILPNGIVSTELRDKHERVAVQNSLPCCKQNPNLEQAC